MLMDDSVAVELGGNKMHQSYMPSQFKSMTIDSTILPSLAVVVMRGLVKHLLVCSRLDSCRRL